MPQENIIYYGDTVHLPYGDKSPDAIRYYSLRIAKFLKDEGCKMIVMACNSASAVASDTLRDFYKEPHVINAVDPLVDKVNKKGYSHIGIIGTRATIDSKSYEKRLRTTNPQIRISALATPLLVPLIEEELQDQKMLMAVLQSYVDRLPIQELDALLLACTHYPLISAYLKDMLPEDIDILDSAAPTAQAVQSDLEKQGLLNQVAMGTDKFYLSDLTNSFTRTAQSFFKGELHIEKKNLWV